MIMTDEQKRDLFEMLASPGYAVWREWADAQLVGYERVALEDANPMEREEARVTRNALIKFQSMATWLGSQLAKESPQDSLADHS